MNVLGWVIEFVWEEGLINVYMPSSLDHFAWVNYIIFDLLITYDKIIYNKE